MSDTVTSIRQAHKDLTRERILDAAIEVIGDEGETTLTIAAVAARAGITERTVYRHFETRDALVEAVWPRMQAQVNSPGFPKSARALVATPPKLFPAFDEHEGLVLASVYSPAGREVRQRSNKERQKAILGCVAEALPDMAPEALWRRAAIAQLIDSAYGWAVMKELWGLDGEEAGRAAAEAIAVLLGMRSAEAEEPISDEEDVN
jgi:AcrR family transcriptional regulator